MNLGIENGKQVVKHMKSVLIFGGARGIGRVVAEAFVSDGFCVTIVARTREDVDVTAKELSVKGEALGYQADVSVYREVEGAVESHLSRFEGLDVVVNAAGIQSPIGPLWENEPDHWAKNVSINLVGSFNVCHACLPVMINSGGGSIILFSGGGAAYARPCFSAYGCSKTGVLRLVETINEELRESEETGIKTNSGIQGFRDLGIEGMKGIEAGGQEGGVRVYAVAPGAVKTGMTEEVLANKDWAGEKAYQEAVRTKQDGGTSPDKAVELCLFLARERPLCLSGRLIHVNEPYRDYVNRFEGKEMGGMGLLRRRAFLSKE